MTAKVEIRPATFNDLPDVARIHVTSWQQTYVGQVPQDYLDAMDVTARQKAWEDIFHGNTAEDKNLDLAIVAGQPVGFISYGLGRDEDMSGHGEIYAAYLLKEVLGQAVGYALFSAARRKLAQAGLLKTYLWVLDTNAQAIRSYARWGGVIENEKIKTATIGYHPIREIMVRFPAP